MRWQASPDERGARLDRYLATHFETARNQVATWIADGRVTVDGRVPKASTRLEGGEWLECTPPERDLGAEMSPEEGPLEVLAEDDDLVFLDKPAGLVVHPGAGRDRDTLAHRLLHHYPEMRAVGGAGRPGIVHRLDAGTSGVIVAARTERAYARLAEAFAERRVSKTYLAIVYGVPRRPAGTIDAPIGRHSHRRKEMAVVNRGRPAVTHYRTLDSEAGLSVLEVRLETGRTHQIRVHLKYRGHPLIGDPVYGEARWKALAKHLRNRLERFPRPALHAWRLALAHPVSGEHLEVEAPAPTDLRELWQLVAGRAWPVGATSGPGGPEARRPG